MDIDPGAKFRTRKISRGLSSHTNRHYVDPWDVENYNYINRNADSSSNTSFTTATPSPAGEPISSTFYYVPSGELYEPTHRGMYAGLEEQSFYNPKYEYEKLDGDTSYATYTDLETSSDNHSSSCGSTVSTLRLHTPGFGVASGQRCLILPKPPPSIEFPGPPSHDYHELPYEDYNMSSDCYECVSGLNIPLYDTLRHRQSPSYVARNNNFGLSKKGLLQIDYSCNWNNLDRYIAK